MSELVVTRDGTKMAAAAGANIVVWKVVDGTEIVRMQLPAQQYVHHLRFTADGKSLVWCGGQDPMIRTFDVATGRQIREIRQINLRGKESELSSSFLAFSRDGKRAAFQGNGLEILDVETGKVAVTAARGEMCRGCDFSSDGKRIVIHNHDWVRIWDAETGERIRELTRAGIGFPIMSATFSPDGKYVALTAHNRFAFEVWNAEIGKRVCAKPATGSGSMKSVAFTPDNQSILCVEDGKHPYLYHLVGETTLRTYVPPEGVEALPRFAAFMPDRKRLAIVSIVADGSVPRQGAVFVYDVPAAVLDPETGNVDDAAFEKLWADLSTDNELRLARIQKALQAAPKQTVAAFAERLTPMPKARAATVDGWIDSLDDEDFKVRDEALIRLRAAAHEFAPLLKARLDSANAGEIRNRLAFLLATTSKEPTPPDLVRRFRAIALLETMATTDARRLLQDLAGGVAQAQVTQKARAAIERMPKAGN